MQVVTDMFLCPRLCVYIISSWRKLRSKPTTGCPTTNRLPSCCRQSCRTPVHKLRIKTMQSKPLGANCESLRFVLWLHFQAHCYKLYSLLLKQFMFWFGFCKYLSFCFRKMHHPVLLSWKNSALNCSKWRWSWVQHLITTKKSKIPLVAFLPFALFLLLFFVSFIDCS